MGQQVTQILEQAFQGIQANLEELPGGRLSGNIVWDGFTGHDQTDRQKLVREVLKGALGAQIQQIGVLLTYTQAELTAMQAA
jgi:acid stress-induced BolA-like protein IbaG/YrbA